jgi:hypothetical protein
MFRLNLACLDDFRVLALPLAHLHAGSLQGMVFGMIIDAQGYLVRCNRVRRVLCGPEGAGNFSRIWSTGADSSSYRHAQMCRSLVLRYPCFFIVGELHSP